MRRRPESRPAPALKLLELATRGERDIAAGRYLTLADHRRAMRTLLAGAAAGDALRPRPHRR